MSNFWNPHIELSSSVRRSIGVVAVLAVIAAWWGLAATGWFSKNKLPSPLAVVQAFWYLAWYEGKSQLAVHTLASITRVGVSALLVIGTGVPLGVLMGASPKVNAYVSPLVDPFRSAPVAALLPIMVMWFGLGEAMKISFLYVGSIVYLVPMVRDAVRSVPASYLIAAKDIGATEWECVTKVLFPLALPRIMDATIVAVSISWTYITVAEYVNAKEGLGQMIANSRHLSAMDQVFAGIAVIIAVALVTYEALTWWKTRLFKWETKV